VPKRRRVRKPEVQQFQQAAVETVGSSQDPFAQALQDASVLVQMNKVPDVSTNQTVAENPIIADNAS